MGSLELYRITPRALSLFAPYLLAEAVQALESGADGVAAVGAVMDGRSCAAAAGMTTTMCSPDAGQRFCAAGEAASR